MKNVLTYAKSTAGPVHTVSEEESPEFVEEAPYETDEIDYLFVCADCGQPLTEIPYYNRWYCEGCQLHY